ncbi:glycosyltransferase ArnT-like protein [Psychroflexus aestuariivivens]|uniref:glycosyltransferase ArnT-like protein n=1 Tax=Psychroflexus aestuariivivens TaxID=1795040 RepID=UPI000FDB83C0|nr:glycosyltransferase ArnT-like protein [Psychroflexus aestuariivivens]
MKAFLNHKSIQVSAILLLACAYVIIGYFTERHNFIQLFGLYTLAFICSVYLFKSKLSLRFLIGVAFGLKLIVLFTIPNLSQDFYRFIWDGMLTANAHNPYLHKPVNIIDETFVEKFEISKILFENMGDLSANNYSNYPPFAQLIYALSWQIAGENILLNAITLRLFNIFAEVIILIYGLKILKTINLPKRHILIFILNPLVIIESTINLHFEVVMIAFLMVAIYKLSQTKLTSAATFWAFSVVSKLMTLMFLPLLWSFFRHLKSKIKPTFKTDLSFYILLSIFIIASYMLFFDEEFLDHYQNSLGLYFNNFEFNASIYYVLRWIGFQIVGYNLIAVFGKVLAILTLIFVLWLSFRKRKINLKTLLKHMLFASTAYYLLSTTVHPWYLLLPLSMSIFTKYKYMLLWSYLVILSYAAYEIDTVNEKSLLITIQYIIAIVSLCLEIFSKSLKRYYYRAFSSTNNRQ